MPTSLDFDRAAAIYDRVAADLETVLGPTLAMLGAETVSGGQLGLVVDATVDAATTNVNLCVGDLLDCAALCRQRAETCRQFEAELRSYQNALDLWSAEVAPDGVRLAPRPARPPRPSAWVEV